MADEMTFPNENFKDEIDYVGYKLTLEHIKLQLIGPSAVDEVRANMRKILQDFGDKRFDAGVTTGIEMEQAVGE